MANVTVDVAASADDGFESADDSTTFQTNGIWIKVVAANADSTRMIGFFRFVIPTIASGDTIDSATLAIANIGTDMDCDMYCEDVDDADNLTDTADIVNRTLTTAFSAWTEAGIANPDTSPAFTSAVQEVIDRAGWSAGNALACIWVGRDGVSPDDVVFADSFDRSTTAPQISIDYTPAAGGHANRLVNSTRLTTKVGGVLVG